MSERDRALATELCYGVLRHLARLDRALAARSRRGLRGLKPDVLIALRLAAYQLLFLDRVPAHAAVDDAAGAVSRRGRSVVGFVNAVLRELSREGEPEPTSPDGDARRAAIEHHSMPEPLIDALSAALAHAGQPPEVLFTASAGFHRRPPLWLRPNRARGVGAEQLVAELAAAGLEAAAHPGGAVRLESAGSPDRLQAFRRGACTVQDLGAQWISVLASPQPGQRILDACAGVGGKTTHLAELAGAGSSVDAADLSPVKLAMLGETAARLDLAGRIRPLEIDLAVSSAGLAQDYDLVVIDAPCTGVGVLRRHPELKWRPGSTDSAELETVQRSLLDRLAPRVRPGGTLVYAVCSFLPAEGSEQIEAFLGRHPEFEPEPGSHPPWLPVVRHPRRWLMTFPHLDDADAFFAARLRRRP